MATTYIYSKSGDFPTGDVVAGQLFGEIEADGGITEILVRVIETVGDDVEITFEAALSAGEEAVLDGLVAAHIPSVNITFSTVGFFEISSSLADPNALVIHATDAAGGIDIEAGMGGVRIDSTNAISLDAGAESNFTTTSGNLVFQAAGLVNIISDAGGYNIGANAVAQTLNLGTGAAAKTINIGNGTDATIVDIVTGTGGFTVDTAAGGPVSIDAVGASSNLTLTGTGDAQDLTIAVTGGWNGSLVLSSTGTAADAIIMSATNAGGGIDIDTSTGGIRADSSGMIYLASSQAAGGSISLDASSGGLTFTGGSFGIAVNSGTGLIGIGHWSAGDIQLGTSATARTITTGSTTGATRSIVRWGTGGHLESQPAHTALGDADAGLTMAQLHTRMFTITPTSTRTLTLPTAATIVADYAGTAVNDSFDFTIVNLAAATATSTAVNTGGTLIGDASTAGRSSSSWRVRVTNIGGGTEAYTLYRLD